MEPVHCSMSGSNCCFLNNGLVPNWERVHQGCILSLCLFNLYAEHIMRNAGLDEAQAGIKMLREISITSDADDTTHMVERKEELKSLLMKVKEES